jgi:hypothetical protein
VKIGGLPSGKRLHNYGKSPFLMGNPTINGPFSIAMSQITRGYMGYFWGYMGLYGIIWHEIWSLKPLSSWGLYRILFLWI